MLDTVAMLAARKTATPAPMSIQVATDLKDTVSSAAASAGNFLEQFPIIISRLLIAGAVLIVGLILLKIGKMIIAAISRRRKKNHRSAGRAETFRSIVSSVFSYIVFFVMAMVMLF